MEGNSTVFFCVFCGYANPECEITLIDAYGKRVTKKICHNCYCELFLSDEEDT